MEIPIFTSDNITATDSSQSRSPYRVVVVEKVGDRNSRYVHTLEPFCSQDHIDPENPDNGKDVDGILWRIWVKSNMPVSLLRFFFFNFPSERFRGMGQTSGLLSGDPYFRELCC